MRVTMAIAVLGLSLGCGATAALSQELDPTEMRLKGDTKSLAAPARTAGTLSAAPRHSLTTGARLFKADAGPISSFKAAQTAESAPALPKATLASLTKRSSSIEPAAASVKPQQR